MIFSNKIICNKFKVSYSNSFLALLKVFVLVIFRCNEESIIIIIILVGDIVHAG